MRNWNLIGHEWAVELLRRHIAGEQLRHAYLLLGPQGVGRRTLALGLAQALNCTSPLAPGEPCGACSSCKRFESMQHPDLSLIQSEQVGAQLKVEQVRDLQHALALSPYEARYRVAMLLRFEEANPSAANALLKTLEEPNPQVILILTAESAESLLPTIVSRCEVLRLRPLPLEHAAQGLAERLEIPAEQAQLLAHLSGGRPGLAIHLQQNPELLEQRGSLVEDGLRLLAQSRAERFSYAEGLAKDKELVRSTLLVWASLWRDLLLRAVGAGAPLTNLDRSERITRLAGQMDAGRIRRMLEILEKTQDRIDHNINARLALEVLMLDMPRSKPV